ncbi:nuclear transport factor 2 family protein [Halorubrum ejinorense]|uniref:Nuclear transport factor 2 family protein n=1 Tax=Halorubrum ejinorense TaxID=425309 RepID=A0AAV3SP98_9EURY
MPSPPDPSAPGSGAGGDEPAGDPDPAVPDSGPAPQASDPGALARAYYDALDAGDYDRLASVLAPDFVQRRPDRTFEGRDRFVAFMRDDRPNTDTTHAVERVYPSGPGVAVHGRLLDADGEELFAFVDVFDVAEGRLTALETYAAES